MNGVRTLTSRRMQEARELVARFDAKVYCCECGTLQNTRTLEDVDTDNRYDSGDTSGSEVGAEKSEDDVPVPKKGEPPPAVTTRPRSAPRHAVDVKM